MSRSEPTSPRRGLVQQVAHGHLDRPVRAVRQPEQTLHRVGAVAAVENPLEEGGYRPELVRVDELEGGALQDVLFPVPEDVARLGASSIWRFSSAVRSSTRCSSSARKREAITERLIRSSHAIDSSRDGLMVVDLKGDILDVNPSMVRLCGARDAAELLGRSSFDLLAPEGRERELHEAGPLFAEGSRGVSDKRPCTLSGDIVPVESTASHERDEPV